MQIAPVEIDSQRTIQIAQCKRSPAAQKPKQTTALEYTDRHHWQDKPSRADECAGGSLRSLANIFDGPLSFENSNDRRNAAIEPNSNQIKRFSVIALNFSRVNLNGEFHAAWLNRVDDWKVELN